MKKLKLHYEYEKKQHKEMLTKNMETEQKDSTPSSEDWRAR